MAVARARQLAAALAAHGLAAPPRRLASAGALLAVGRHDATHVRTLRPPADLLPDLDRPLSCGDLRSRYFLIETLFEHLSTSQVIETT